MFGTTLKTNSMTLSYFELVKTRPRCGYFFKRHCQAFNVSTFE